MPIPLTYLPSTIVDRASGPTDDEKKALQSAKANLREPVDFDFSGAYEMLRDRGYDERAAMNTIALKLGEKNNFDVQAAKEAGFTTENIVAKLIGRDRDDLAPAPVGTFVGGLGRGFVSNLPAGAAGTATALGLGAAGLAAAPATIGGLLVMLGVGALTAEEVEEAVFDERQLLPSERPFGVAGETLGAIAPLSGVVQVGARGIKESVDFGSRRLMQRVNQQRRDALRKGEDPTAIKDINKDKRRAQKRVVLETIVENIGKSARAGVDPSAKGLTRAAQEAKSFAKFAGAETLMTVVPATFEAFSEALYPGDNTMRTIGGILGSVVPQPTIIAGQAIGAGATAAKADVDEKGFVESAKNLFGIRDAGERRRQQQAKEYLAQAFRAHGGDPIAFAEELDELLKLDPEFADLLTPGQLTNNPFFLMQEAVQRQNNRILSNEQKRAGEKAAASISSLIEGLKSTNNQQALRLAGELEQETMATQLTALVEQAMTKAAFAAEKAGVVGAKDKTSVQISREQGAILKQAAIQAMNEAKEVRRKLYDAVDKRVIVDPTPLLQAYRQLTAQNLLTEAGELKGDFIKDLRNYGLDDSTDVFREVVTEAGKRKKTLTNRLNTIGSTFQRTADANPEAFSEFDLLVDTLGGPQKRGYETRLNNVIVGFSKKADEEGALGLDLAPRVRTQVLKLAQTAKEIETVQRNIATIDADLNNISVSDFVTSEAVPQTLGEMLAFRNKVRKAKRAAEKGFIEGPDTAQLAVLDNGVNAAIQQKIDDGLAAGRDANLEALRRAETFANEYNRVFNQTFAGDLGRTKAAGAPLIDPEVAVDRLFLGLPGQQFKRVEDMLAAMKFSGVQSEDLAGTVSGAMDAYLRQEFARRASGAEFTNPFTGETQQYSQFDQAVVDDFLDTYSDAILALESNSGSLIEDLRNVGTSQVALQAALSTTSDRAKTNAKEINLGKFLEAESVEKVVTGILVNAEPEKGILALVKKINEAPVNEAQKADLRDGLFSSVLGSVISKSRAKPSKDGDAIIDFRKLYNVLYDTQKTKDTTGFGNFKEGGKSLMRILEDSGTVTSEQAKELGAFLKRGKDLQDALSEGVDDFLQAKDTSLMKDFVARYGGAKSIGLLTESLGLPADVQTPGLGARLSQNQFINLPQMVYKDLLIDVSKPGAASVLRDALREGATTDQQISGLTKFAAKVAGSLFGAPTYYLSLGLRSELEQQQEQPSPVPPPAPAAPAAPVAPPIAGPAPAALTRQTPPAVAQPPAAPDPTIRQRYAALYPNDPVSSLIEQQGIAGLPQAPR